MTKWTLDTQHHKAFWKMSVQNWQSPGPGEISPVAWPPIINPVPISITDEKVTFTTEGC